MANTYQEATALLPELSSGDVLAALGEAQGKLDASRHYEIRCSLNDALRNYVSARIWESGAATVTPSARAERLKQLVEKTRRVLQARGAQGDPLSDSTSVALLSALADRGVEAKTLFGPLTKLAGKGSAVAEDGTLAPVSKNGTQRRHRLTGFEQLALLEGLWRALDLLHDAAKTAHDTERRRIAIKASDKDRHRGDEAMRSLFLRFNEIWIGFFGELPGITWDEHHGELRGPYVQFVECLLHGYAERVPDALESLAPGLRHGLRLTRPGIHAHFRGTSVSSLRHEISHALRDQSSD